ncbi:MAG: nickel/cobalt transporter (NicO) family protein, partial [Alphaproteobacteria bacterium]|nr:nickel/cobalt transporter (NicO) family protein [Alphaproteobacteria bacterium]
MSLTKVVGGRRLIALTLLAAAASILLAAGVLDAAFAQGSPFGAPRGAPPAPPADGLIGWIFAKQAEFYQNFSRIIRSAKTDGTAVWTLLGVSFLYGIFHAAGPGHGKAVISSYLVANEETWRRGIVLSFASALLQALVAVALVGVAAVVLNATARQMCDAGRVIELASYALIALLGARLIWVKGKGFLREARNLSRPLHAVGAAVTPKDHH